ncbi:MAG: hypothetical protein EOO43_27105 [Flavobacterium sp.]|nr:MAG: hypothetical protein EOO43_27105 [Flavobacterium sp.]
MYNHGKLGNGVTLTYDTVFGINYHKVNKNLLNIGEGSPYMRRCVLILKGYIIFSVGTSIAVKDLQTKTTKFFSKEHRLRYVTCLNAAYEKGENILVAVGESTPSGEEKAAHVIFRL